MPFLIARSQERGLLFDLLAYAARDAASGSAQGIPARRLAEVDDRQMQWVSEAGLMPLLYRAAREGIGQVPAARREMLLSADLTAIAWHGNLIDATREIVEACEARGIRATLLKGISISDQYYPDAHLRPMGDIDILVSAPEIATVESTILQLGYRRQPHYQHRAGAHHGAPLFHPERHGMDRGAQRPVSGECAKLSKRLGLQPAARGFSQRQLNVPWLRRKPAR